MYAMKKKKNIAGDMGAKSNQTIRGFRFSMNIDPLERLNQRMAGRTQGRGLTGLKKKKTLLG
jgi:hypothetical protein